MKVLDVIARKDIENNLDSQTYFSVNGIPAIVNQVVIDSDNTD